MYQKKQNPQMPKGRWVDGEVRVTKGGKIEFRRNPGGEELGESAFNAGRSWRRSGADSSGVANSRVVRYGFLKWYNDQRPEDLKSYRSQGSSRRWTKASLEKKFREGYRFEGYTGKR